VGNPVNHLRQVRASRRPVRWGAVPPATF